MKKKISLMIAVILILQIMLPMLTVIWESEFTIKSIAAKTLEATVDGITWTYTLDGENNAVDVKPKDKSNLPQEVIMPSILDGHAVISIGHQAFDNCNNIKSIEISEGITEIKAYAFLNCTNLEVVKIPSTVNSIKSRVFQYCNRLKNIEIPTDSQCANEMFFDSVMQIWVNPEEMATNEIELPEIIKRAKDEESNLYTEKDFNLKNCEISEDNTKLIINEQELKKGSEVSLEVMEGPLDGLTVLIMRPEIIWDIAKDVNSSLKATFNYNDGSLIISGNGAMKDFGWDFGPWYYLKEYIENVTIEEGATSIGTYCFFDNDYMNNIILPTTIKLIAPYAFRGCSNLESIEIPEGTQTIGTGAFSSCDNLREVNISSTVFAIGTDTVSFEWNEGMLEGLNFTSSGEVFNDCQSLISINVDENNQNYSSENGILFNKNKSSLISYPAGKEEKEYKIPSTVESIGSDAFDSCVNLQTIEIPGTVKEIKGQCFRGSNLSNVILNEGVKSIGAYAFYENDTIEEIYIPSSVENIGEGALCKMEALRNIEVSKENNNYSSENGILFNKDKTKILQYPADKSEISYRVPDSVKVIGMGAFGYSNNLNYLILKDNVSEIGTSAFVFSKLIGVYIPNSVNKIGTFNVGGAITPFYGNEECTTYCNEESYAKEFCIKYNLKYSTNISEVIERVESSTLEFIEIETLSTKVNYIEGETFDKSGMKVTATYNDGSKREITNYTISPNGTLTTSDNKVTISYTENGITKTAEQEITVVAKALTGITISKAPTKTDYIVGQTFDKTGMKVMATYNNGSSKEITNYEMSPNGALTTSDNKVTISYTENNVTKTTEQAITVTAKQDPEPEESIKGDVNGDNKVDFMDILAINKHRLGKSQLTGMHLEAADVNGDSKVDFMDILQINKYRLGKINSL